MLTPKTRRGLSGPLYAIVLVSLLGAPGAANAQPPADAQPQAPPAVKDPAPEAAPPPATAAVSAPIATAGTAGRRLFGVFPNHATVEGATLIRPISTARKFGLATQNSFDPVVFPFVAGVAAVGAGAGQGGYAKRYAMALADNTVQTYMTVGVLPAVFHQDPRYFQQGRGGTWRRASHTLTRSFVTRSDAGTAQFNAPEIAGNLLAAGISNLYRPAGERTVADTLTRWGMQVLWDTVSNELKEFWPDIRRRFRKT